MSIVFFDFETGGVSPDHPNIQLAAIAVDSDWNELETFERKIQFKESDADPEALKMNHYDAALWASEAKREFSVVNDFAAFLNRHKSIELVSKRTGNPYSVARLAGHNAATFDGPRLSAMFKHYGVFLSAHPQVMCSLQRALWYAMETGAKFESLKLSVLCAHFGIPIPDAHDALADVRGSIAVSRAMASLAVAR